MRIANPKQEDAIASRFPAHETLKTDRAETHKIGTPKYRMPLMSRPPLLRVPQFIAATINISAPQIMPHTPMAVYIYFLFIAGADRLIPLKEFTGK